MSPGSAMALLSLPPVRGAAALLFLVLVGSVPFMDDSDLGILARLGLGGALVTLGTPIWVMTLQGFWRDVRLPEGEGRTVILALRHRGLAVVLSWTALAITIGCGLALGSMLRWGFGSPLLEAPVLLLPLLTVPVASVLPALSRRWALGAGTVTVSPAGLTVNAGRDTPSHTVSWPSVGEVRAEERVVDALCGDPARDLVHGLGRRMRWRPGARAAVARFARDGFAPTAEDVRLLGLNAAWSEDPDAARPSRAGRLVPIAVYLWVVLVCAMMLIGVGIVTTQGEAPWWALALFTLLPLFVLVIIVPRLLRVLRRADAAQVTRKGWLDRHHQQGLIPWERIERIHVRAGDVLVVLTPDAPELVDRDLGNRMNARVEAAIEITPVRIRSAGAGFREVQGRSLAYPQSTGAYALVSDAEEIGGVAVERSSGALER